MNRPRMGGPPEENGRHYEPHDDDRATHPLDLKVESGLAPVKRDTKRNRIMAKQNGWSDEEFEDWCSEED